MSAEEIASKIQTALEQRRFKRAWSILEHGIAKLESEVPVNVDPYHDETTIYNLDLDIRTLRLVERWGHDTLGKLRRAATDGKLQAIPEIGVIGEAAINEALNNYVPRVNRYRRSNKDGC